MESDKASGRIDFVRANLAQRFRLFDLPQEVQDLIIRQTFDFDAYDLELRQNPDSESKRLVRQYLFEFSPYPDITYTWDLVAVDSKKLPGLPRNDILPLVCQKMKVDSHHVYQSCHTGTLKLIGHQYQALLTEAKKLVMSSKTSWIARTTKKLIVEVEEWRNRDITLNSWVTLLDHFPACKELQVVCASSQDFKRYFTHLEDPCTHEGAVSEVEDYLHMMQDGTDWDFAHPARTLTLEELSKHLVREGRACAIDLKRAFTAESIGFAWHMTGDGIRPCNALLVCGKWVRRSSDMLTSRLTDHIDFRCPARCRWKGVL